MKPPRTLGISLAILLSVFIFTVLPFLQIVVLLLIQYRAAQANFGVDATNPVNPIFSGGSFGGVSNDLLIVQSLLGAIYLVVAFFAWRGRPQSVRHLLVVSVLILTVLYVWDILTALLSPIPLSAGIDSGGGISRTLQCVRLITNLLIPLYVIWYINRAPARAFFRGTYLPDGRGQPPTNAEN